MLSGSGICVHPSCSHPAAKEVFSCAVCAKVPVAWPRSLLLFAYGTQIIFLTSEKHGRTKPQSVAAPGTWIAGRRRVSFGSC